MKRSFRLSILPVILLMSAWCHAQQPESPLMNSFRQYEQKKAQTQLHAEWIPIGPTINSARADAIQVDINRPGTMYVAFGSGNLWKTVNNGLTWEPIFENQAALGIGDVALAPSNSNIIYLGTGESLKKPRNFTMPGTGVYRSDDAGATWRHLGLNDSWHIGEIAVHPTNPDIALVAVLGHFWSDNENRGVYRTEDGGKTWQHVLYVNEQTGANDIVIAPSDPNIVYASMWQHSPQVHGENSGIYKSEDGGKTWKKASNGLPNDENVGRIGLAVSYSNPNKAYALIDHRNRENGEGWAKFYSTFSGGNNWQMTHEKGMPFFSTIGWYFADMYVNPQNDNEIYGLGPRVAHSQDGGMTFDYLGGDIYHIFPMAADFLHLDNCEMWINPTNPNHMALVNDGGLYTTMDKGKTWQHHNNIPAGEFYDISVDNQEPYKIYGGVQDDASVYGPSLEYDPRYAKDWKYIWIDAWSGGDGCVTCVDPVDPNIVYFSMQNGSARRKDMAADTSTSIRPRLPRGHEGRLRFNYMTPYFISPHDRHTLYHAGNYMFKSTDMGDSWEVISKDLSVSADEKRASTAAGAIAESPMTPGLLYMGTDKGAFWVSRNDGKTWTEHSTGLPTNYVISIEPSAFKESRVYVTLSGMNYDDLGAHVFVSDDYGANWRSISEDLPNETANVIREDPTDEDILYAGLYRGVYISMDRGEHWSILGTSLPAVSVADLEIQERANDLVVATHGRGIYKLNLDPVREMKNKPEQVMLFDLPEFRRPAFGDTHRQPEFETMQKTTISYYLPSAQTVTLSIENAKGEVIWKKEQEGESGLNQYRWDLILRQVSSDQAYFIHFNEFIPKGSYTMNLMVGDTKLTKAFEVLDF
ncbi:WD40/YVTN/BNR-like repeat-containing protein [Roseivirga sp.]|uniref:WD40/YVTN/BNR-like repeat-containing protein n=1 Tax=Roseivirga sp. TaxID=1964215 RepID=UPI003B51A132